MTKISLTEILNYIRVYFKNVGKTIFGASTLVVALLVFLNYHFHLDHYISSRQSFWYSFFSRYLIFFIAFSLPYLLYRLFRSDHFSSSPGLLLLIALAPAIFSLKIALDIPLHFAVDPGWNEYWNNVFYWPLRLVITCLILWIIWVIRDKDQPFYGCVTRNINWKPYLIMLLIMLPLIAAASTQPDFLAMYPKLKSIAGIYEIENLTAWHRLLFELSYGSDFISIEVFFRGFLVLGFIKWVGKDAILPMACFYCMIHFGKPLGECISSYFGGLILGIIVYHTRSIFGGLIVHLGIAWLMEAGGYIGNGGNLHQ